MINIRYGAFETNSSSMHSFIIANTYPHKKLISTYAYLETKRDGTQVLVINDVDFSYYANTGILTTWMDKLAYYIAYEFTTKYMESSDVKDFKKEIFNEVHKRYPSVVKIKYPDDLKEIPYPYLINHQSNENMDTFLTDNNLSWQEMVFDKKYVIVPTSDAADVYTVLNQVQAVGYDDFESMTTWSTHKITDGIIEGYEFDE